MAGAVKGVAAASLLNASTTRNREYAVLTVIDNDAETGTQKVTSFGFSNIDEATLRKKLAQAIPVWVEPVVKQMEDYYGQSEDKNDAAYAAVPFANC